MARKVASKSEKRQRTRSVAIRLTPKEGADLDAAADRAGLSAGAYLRATALGNTGPRAVRRPPAAKVELVKVLAAVGSLDGNVNQMARTANSTGIAPQAEQLREIQSEIMSIRGALFLALGRLP